MEKTRKLKLSAYFYPRSPCGERHTPFLAYCQEHIFLSTLSLRRATKTIWTDIKLFIFLSTLSLRRATINTYHRIFGGGISIHALLAESDVAKSLAQGRDILFLSTLSLRRATRLGLLGWLRVLISIHALLAESDFFKN